MSRELVRAEGELRDFIGAMSEDEQAELVARPHHGEVRGAAGRKHRDLR